MSCRREALPSSCSIKRRFCAAASESAQILMKPSIIRLSADCFSELRQRKCSSNPRLYSSVSFAASSASRRRLAASLVCLIRSQMSPHAALIGGLFCEIVVDSALGGYVEEQCYRLKS